MRTTPVLAAVVGISFLAAACGSRELAVCKKIRISELAKEKYGTQQWPESWPDESVQCSIGDYVVVTAAARSSVDHVMLFRGTDEMFVRQGGVSSVFEKARPVLDATDSDGDGAFDKISYSAYGVGNWDEVTVSDVNLDGQPDLRVYKREGAPEYWMWVDDGWYQTPRLGSMQVLVDGTRRAYRAVDGRFTFVDGAQGGRITKP
jgi:hypothetical protein